MKFIDSLKKKISIKIKNNTFFQNFFGFETGIDVTDDNKVLYRKNTVIKNIIFLSNLFYTIVFALITIGDTSNWSNWILTILLFPVTFFVNATLKKLIKKGPDDKMSQLIAMYFSCFYMFLSSIIVYLKLKYGDATFLQEVGYILLYYSLTVCAFYQDKKLLKNIFLWVFILVTILHFIVTYNIFTIAQEKESALEFLKWLISSDPLKDIIIRTVLLLMFMLVLYIYVSMAEYMQEERKRELIKRRDVQDDFTKVVTQIFDVTLDQSKISEEEKKTFMLIGRMSNKLASLLSFDVDRINELEKFSTVHIDNIINFDDNNFKTEDEKFENLRHQTEIGSKIITRLQLSRKCESIVRASLENTINDDFVNQQRNIQNNEESQIILICELYVTLRSFNSYKRAYNHQKSIMNMEELFKIYFDPVIFDRFIKFSSDFEKMYDEL